MSEYDELREDIGRALKAVTASGEANMRAWTANVDDHTALWCDIGEMRDAINAVANRLEALTRAVTTSPAEVAATIVNDANRETLRTVPYPMCRCGHRHDHHRHHEPGKGCYDCDSCRGYNPWPIEAVDRG